MNLKKKNSLATRSKIIWSQFKRYKKGVGREGKNEKLSKSSISLKKMAESGISCIKANFD